MFGNQDKLFATIGRLTVQLDIERGEKQQVINLLRAVKDGSIDPLRITITDKGIQVAPVEDNGKAEDEKTSEGSHLSEVP